MGKTMKKQLKKLTRGKIAAIISVVSTAVIVCVLAVVNIFFPLKYVGAYFVSRSRSPSDGMYIHILDVGHSDCAIVEFPDGKTMLIDGGDGTYKYTYEIIKALNRLDIDTIDYLVCTSVNEDHCGGLAEIMEVKDVGTIYCPYTTSYINDSYYEFYTAAEASGAEMVISEYGAGAEGGEGDLEYYFVFISPSVHTNTQSEYYTMNTSPTDENIDNASAVLWIECGGKGIFYASDVHSYVLDFIADSYTLCLGSGDSYISYGSHTVNFDDCVLYKTANYGSYDSISTALYKLITPDISVISVGQSNAEGCPSVYVIADLVEYGDLYMTMYQGSITVKVNKEGASI